MTARQRNQMAMFMAVKNVFGFYPDELKAIPALESSITDFNTKLLAIDAVHEVQMGNTTGSTQLKQQAEKEMIDATVRLAAAMYVYAQIENKPDLLEKCKISPSSLEKLSAEKLRAQCVNVYNDAFALGDGLSDFGQTGEDVAKLKTEIDEYAEVISAPRTAIVTRAQARQELGVLIDEANDILRNRVDKLMQLLETSQPKVYNTYKAARVIVDLRAGKQVVEEE